MSKGSYFRKVSSPKVDRFVCSLFGHRNPDVLFLWCICVMFWKGDELRGRKLMEEAMEAENPKATYLFCMLELQTSPYLESVEVDRVLSLLGSSLKDKEDMLWLRAIVIMQFSLSWNDRSELEFDEDDWLGCHGNCYLFPVVGLNPNVTVDYYDNDLGMYCKANRERDFLYIG